MREGFVELALLAQDVAEVVMGCGEIGSHPDSVPKLLGGLVVLAQPLKGQPEITERLRIIGPETQGRAAATGSAIQLAQCTIRLGQIGVESRRVGPQDNRAPDQLDGPRVLPLLVM